MRRAQQQVILFLATNTSGVRQTGLTWADGELKLSKDGAAFVDLLGNRISEVGLGYYSITLTAAETNAGLLVLAQVKSGIATFNDIKGLTTDQRTAAVAGSGQTTTSFITDLTETATDAHKGKLVRFQTGTLAGQVRKCTAYNGTTKALTFTDAFSAAPSAADVFALIDD